MNFRTTSWIAFLLKLSEMYNAEILRMAEYLQCIGNDSLHADLMWLRRPDSNLDVVPALLQLTYLQVSHLTMYSQLSVQLIMLKLQPKYSLCKAQVSNDIGEQ